MTLDQTDAPKARKPLRLWPGVAIVTVLLLARFVLPIDAAAALMSGLFGGLAVAAWWVLLSRAPWSERVGAVVLAGVALYTTRHFLHESIARAGQGMLFFILVGPVLSFAFVASAWAGRHLSDRARRATMAAAVVLACGAWTLVRMSGVTGGYGIDLGWRWTPSPEERLLAQSAPAPASLPSAPPVVLPSAPPAPEAEPAETPAQRAAASAAEPAAPPPAVTAAELGPEWPSFSGRGRDSSIPGVRIETDWSAAPPAELWRRPIGPGWSSFAVQGGRVYTQEQRGDDEIVSCYDAATGEPLWQHRDAARFWEANAGPGPRATPTLADGRVYTLGATGIVNALDARTGAVVWSRDAAADTEAKLPTWGFAGSPLAVGELVIVAAGGAPVAYDAASGEPRWRGPAGGTSYSSPHLATIGGVAQVLLASKSGVKSLAPADGTLLWEHAWPGYPIVQPALTADGDVLVAIDEAQGTRRLAPARGPGGWTVAERWTSLGLKPYFNDFVVHNGHAFGFDGGILSCIDLQDGARKWKGGRYGHGQLVLLPDQDLLLVLSEKGELALVKASSDQFTELARVPALEGKTWNHPALVGDVLLVRNGQEMAAFRLALASR